MNPNAENQQDKTEQMQHSAPPVALPLNNPAIAPQPRAAQPTPPAKGNKSTLAIIAIVGVFVAMAIGISNFIATTNKTSALEQKLSNTQKRLAAVETAKNTPLDDYEMQQIDKQAYQTVFLTTDLVYFGKITQITANTIKITDIYYLNKGAVDASGNVKAGTSISLKKLGAELHAPEDIMLIERKNVSYWQNIKNDGQVSKAIAEYQKGR